jgi:hypothetical protein
MLRDLLGPRGTDELVEEINFAFENAKKLGWQELRPWGEFFGAFKLPQMDVKNIEQRATTNFLHYRSNYLALCCGILMLQVLFSPMLLVAIPVAVVVCLYILVVRKSPIVISSVVISENGKVTFCSLFVLFFFAIAGVLERLVWTVLYCLLVCIAHLVCRPRSVTSKTNKVFEEMKLNNVSSWFGSTSDKSTGPGGLDNDPENPKEKVSADPSSGSPYGAVHSSGFGNTTAGDMRKRGGNSSIPYLSAGAGAGGSGRDAAAPKND